MYKRGKVGVSEIYGYILVFVMVSFFLTLVYLQAMPQIRSYENYANMKVMEGEFIVLGDHISSIALGITEEKIVNLNVKKGVVYSDEIANVNFSGKSLKITGLVYSIDGMKLYLVFGAVVECFDNGCVVLTDPPFVNGSKSYIQIINLTCDLAFTGMKSLSIERENVRIYNGSYVNITFKDSKLKDAFARALDKFNYVSGNNYLNISLNEGVITLYNVSIK